jgi:hypothetical protein
VFKRAAIYKDKTTSELPEAAERAGWQVAKVIRITASAALREIEAASALVALDF